jgi:periplasmic protein TonB
MFRIDDIARQPAPYSRRVALSASCLAHALGGIVVVWLVTLPQHVVSTEPARSPRNDIVWLSAPGPGGGGGGGGDKTKLAAPVKEIGPDKVTVPVAPKPEPKPTPVEPPPEPLTIPAKPLEAAMESLPGVVEPSATTVTTQGAGSGGGGGTGAGTGSGDGTGSGLGPGFGGGTGGGAYKPGSGVSAPQLVRDVKPEYTAEAMRAKAQGVVLLECVVLQDGAVGDCRIMKSLDKVFGLDDQAMKAAKQWKFLPGRRLGEPVPVLVTIELAFSLR